MKKIEYKNLIKKYVFLFIGMICGFMAYGQQNIAEYSPMDKAIFDRYMEYIAPYSGNPLNEVIIETGKFFLDVPYVAHTLEAEPEELVVNLRELDCTTFVENVLALSRTVKGEEFNFDSFLDNLRQIRYQGGEITDYASRLHYMTQWIYDNEKDSIIKDVTRQIGGVPFPVNISFMSQHPDSYKQLKDRALVEKLRKLEEEVNQRFDTYYYIPKQQAGASLDKLQDGDIVLFTTAIEGLDVSHVGFIYKEDDRTTFMHASTSGKKVLINEAPLTDYMNRIKSNTGMIILRPQDVK